MLGHAELDSAALLYHIIIDIIEALNQVKGDFDNLYHWLICFSLCVSSSGAENSLASRLRLM